MTIKSRTIDLFLILVTLTVVFPAISRAQSTGKDDLFSTANRLEFGNHLYKEKDYLRAMNEYRIYLKSTDNDTVQYRFADCFFRMNRFAESADNFKSLFFRSDISEEARLMFYKSVFFQGDFISFRNLAGRGIYSSGKYGQEIKRLLNASYFLDNSPLPDENIILAPFPDSVRQQISRFYYLKKFPHSKNITTAVLLSTALPGAGKIYTGDIGDGLTSFAATALSVYLAYSNFKAGHQFRGWLFTGLSAFLYAGNIYGSAASAQIYNARLRFDFDSEVRLFFEGRNYFLPETGF